MSGRASGKRFDEIKKQKEELLDKYLQIMASKFNCNTINDVFEQGYPISDLEKFNDVVSKEVWGNKLPESNWRFNCRLICEELLTTIYGSPKIYFKTKAFIDRKVNRAGNTMENNYGYRNYGQSDTHKLAMSKGPTCKNPFSTKDFMYKEYIKGKRVLDKDKDEFIIYREKVNKLTEINRKNVIWTGYCYYTGIPIRKYDGNKTVNRNDFDCGTIDHKISVLAGFLRGISPEIIASEDNLCWCSLYFNSAFKKEKCEDEIRLSGMIERFKEVWEIIKNENKGSEIIEE